MTVNLCTVSGTLVAPDGSPLPEVEVRFLPAPVSLRGQGGTLQAPRPVAAVTDAAAGFSVGLAPGVYTLRAREAEGREYPPALVDVPATEAADLAEITLHLPAPQSVYDAAASARAAARAAGVAQTLADDIVHRAHDDMSFSSRAAFAAATVPDTVQGWSVVHAGRLLSYMRDPDGTAIASANAVAGSPAGEVRPEHWGALADGLADDAAAINAAIAHVAGRGGGVVLLRAERTYACGSTILHHPLVTVRGDGGMAVVRLADGANTRLWETPGFAAQKADMSAGIARGIGLIDILFSGNRANNPAGEGVFLAESGGFFQNVHIDDFAGTGFERAGFRAVDFADNGSGNFPISPFVRRVETFINDMFVWRCGSATAPAFLLDGPGDLRCGHLFVGGNDGKAIFASASADFGYVHLYANGAAHVGDYANEIIGPSMFSTLEVRDCDWSGLRIASDEVQVSKLYATKNGRRVNDGTGRQILIEGNRCAIADAYVGSKIQTSGTFPGDGSMPLVEIAGNQNVVRGTLTGNIGAERRAVAGLIHSAGAQNRVDVVVFGIEGPAVRFQAGTQCDIRASIANAATALEKNGANVLGSFMMSVAGSVGTTLAGTDAVVRATERWSFNAGGLSLTERRLLSPDLVATATGTGMVSLPHGLLSQPAFADMQVSVVRGATPFPGDAEIEAYVESRDASNVHVRWRVRTASAVSGAMFRVAVWVKMGF